MIKQFLIVLAITVSIMPNDNDVLAEEIACPLGVSCELSLEGKIQKSLNEAILIVLGTFSVTDKKYPLESLSDNEAFKYVTFSVEKTYKGVEMGSILKLKIPIYVQKEKASTSTEISSDIMGFLKSIQEFERELEAGDISIKKYGERLRNVRENYFGLPENTRDGFILVPIKRGGLDVRYRITDVPVVFGNKYVLFLFRELARKDYTAVFPWEIDLYPTAIDGVSGKFLSILENR